jgi:uncharacterized protein (TIGR02145 family)
MAKFSRLFVPLTVSLLFICAPGCNKDDDDETTDSMTGTLAFDLPGYLLAGEEITLEATGITEPEDGITYKWTTTGFGQDSTEGQSVTIITPLETGDYSVTLTAQADGYYSRSSTLYTVIIDPDSESSFSGVTLGSDYITDPRDGQRYYYTTIGNLQWFSTNLNWKGSGRPYKNIEALSYIYGRLYSWEEATGGGGASPAQESQQQGACPAGWRVPTNADWENLASHLNNGVPVQFDNEWKGLGGKITVDAILNSSKIWKYSPNNDKSNMFLWNALPGGNATGTLSSFINMNYYGIWWSSTLVDSNTAAYRYIYFDSPDFPYNLANKTYFGASVRCVREVNQ